MKKLLVLVLAIMSLSISTTAFADDTNIQAGESNIVDETNTLSESVVEPRINLMTKTRLDTSFWGVITADNNLLTAHLTVKNHDSSPGSVLIKITNERGTDITTETTVPRGESVTFRIPFDAGHYSVKGKAVSKNGVYTFTVKD